MNVSELDYELPSGLIAQTPVEPRDASRLLVVAGRGGGLRLEDRGFCDLRAALRPGDVLVSNDTRVFPARVRFRRPTGGRIEVLFLEPATGEGAQPAPGPATASVWEALARGRARVGERLVTERGDGRHAVELRERLGGGRWLVASASGEPLAQLFDACGETPLPPYIKVALADPERYQTVYATQTGSAAAPTAGLHFSGRLERELEAAGITLERMTLHVGLATFKPIDAERVEEHPLHSERFALDSGTWRRIMAARAEGRRVVAVGTTMVRLLEELAHTAPGGAAGDGPLAPDASGRLAGRTGLFITPGHRFAVVDGMITNFHLPRTSLLALVMAFCGIEETRRAYAHAIAAHYRFYSFGDAMLAWRGEEAVA